MRDPYKVLGVSPYSSDDEVKRAYRELAKKYHPDNYHDNPLGDLANEKMKEINEAYDEIQRRRAQGQSGYGRSYSSDSSYSSYSSSSGSSGRQDLKRIRELIDRGSYTEAAIVCDSVSQNMRNAEWYYLRARIYMHQGSYNNAVEALSIACRMDPTNDEYASLYETLRSNQARYGGFSGGGGDYGCSACDICSGLLCADCLCECCGGDLIRCC